MQLMLQIGYVAGTVMNITGEEIMELLKDQHLDPGTREVVEAVASCRVQLRGAVYGSG
jgi:hypothetical protein